MLRIGFIGLGHMGYPMAINLIRAGHVVTGFDLVSDQVRALVVEGGKAATTLQALAESQEVIITMLQTGDQVQKVCLGPEGLFASAQKDTLFVDCSSIDVQSSRAIHEEARRYGLLAVDAPVSGGVKGAAQGSLTIMVGGTDKAFQQAKPILLGLGKKIIHTGVAGNGQAAKICNNMILGISMIAVSEAFVLAKQLGLAPEKLFEVVTNSSGQCWAMSHYAPLPGLVDNVPANNNYQPGFTAAMMLKDLNLSQQSAAQVGVKTPLGEKAAHMYQQFTEATGGGLDFSAIITSIAHS